MPDKQLTGRTAFVSGSGRNIGRAVAVELAARGCNLVLNGAHDRAACEETARLVQSQGVEALIIMGDVADPATIEAIVSGALGRFGTVDIVINNAAIRPHKSFVETTDEDWNSVVDTGLTAAFKLSRAFLPGMIEKGWGRIINMTGMNSIRGYFEGAAISASKHALWGLTKALSVEFAPKGVTVNAISPGQILTDGRDANDPKRLATIPTGFMGTPEDISAMVGLLASDEGRFISGQMIGINGGEST